MRVHLISLGPGAPRFAIAAALLSMLFACCALATGSHTRADPLADAQLLRRSGCAGAMSAQQPLKHVQALDRAAAHWALGQSLGPAAARSSYAADQLAGVHISTPDEQLLPALRRSGCAMLMRSDMTEIGL